MKKLVLTLALVIAGLAAASAQTNVPVVSGTPVVKTPETNDLVYLAGAIKKPGEYHWTNGMTFKDAVTAAGGFAEHMPQHLIIRHRDGTKETFKIKKADPFKKNPVLKSGDYVGCLREVD
jgi:protein involved in polysaccharide export with SLBB domain